MSDVKGGYGDPAIRTQADRTESVAWGKFCRSRDGCGRSATRMNKEEERREELQYSKTGSSRRPMRVVRETEVEGRERETRERWPERERERERRRRRRGA